MWTIRVRRNIDNQEKPFEFSNGEFKRKDDLISFSQSSHLFIVKIEGNNQVIYLETTASQQIVLFDGKIFLYSELASRFYSSLFHLVSLIVFIYENFNRNHIESVERSVAIYFSAVIEGFISELGKSIINIRRERIKQKQSKEFFDKHVNIVLNRFNNPKKKNMKQFFHDLNLYPKICDKIDFSTIDEIVDYRNRIAHGAKFQNDLNLAKILDYYKDIKRFLEHFSKEFYLELSKGDEIDWLYDVRFQTKNGQEKIWNLLPVLIEDIEIKTGYIHVANPVSDR